MTLARSFALAAALVLATGCIRQRVADSYPLYLQKNPSQPGKESAPLKAGYWLTQATLDHEYEFGMGAGHKFWVNFGDMLVDYLATPAVQDALGGIREAEREDKGRVLVFDLKDFSLAMNNVQLTLRVRLLKDGKVVFTESYSVDGVSQNAKLGFGGAFAMQNALQTSVTAALDKVFKDLIPDLAEARP